MDILIGNKSDGMKLSSFSYLDVFDSSNRIGSANL
jgi:hypothetical protein